MRFAYRPSSFAGFMAIKRLMLSVLSLSLMTQAGCAVFFPGDRNSFDRVNERVSLHLLSVKTMETRSCNNELPQDVCDRFHTETGALKPEFAFVAAAPIAAAAAGLALNYIQQQLKQEASTYRAQFVGQTTRGNFWQPGPKYDITTGLLNVIPTYWGFELVRETKDHSQQNELKADNVAFRLICQFRFFPEHTAFQIKAVYLLVNSAKAKVLSPSYFLPWTWDAYIPPKLPSETVDEQISIQMNSAWIDDAQKEQLDQIASFMIPITGNNIDKPAVRLACKPRLSLLGARDASDPKSQCLPPGASGILQSVPRSLSIGSKTTPVPCNNLGDDGDIGCGVFSLKVTVTESNPSKAPQLLENAATEIGSHQQQIINYITTGK
jgi:hypothetical protein